jgi:hypothetical protein
MSSATASESTEGSGLLSANKWGWIGFALFAVPIFALGSTAEGVNMAGLAGTAAGGGAAVYLIFYLVAKVVGKIRS